MENSWEEHFSVLKENGKSTIVITLKDSFFMESEKTHLQLLSDVFGDLLILTVKIVKADWKTIQE